MTLKRLCDALIDCALRNVCAVGNQKFKFYHKQSYTRAVFLMLSIILKYIIYVNSQVIFMNVLFYFEGCLLYR